MQRIQKDRDEDGAEGVVGGGRAYRRLPKMKRRIDDKPMELINEYGGDVRLLLGAEAGDPGKLWHMTNEISWQRNMGLKRTHEIGTAYLCQFLRAIHQSTVEPGDWTTACLMMPGHDHCGRDPCGCAEEDLHVIAAYEDAQRRLEKGGRREHNGDEKTEKQQVDHPKGKGGEKGSRRNAGGDGAAGS